MPMWHPSSVTNRLYLQLAANDSSIFKVWPMKERIFKALCSAAITLSLLACGGGGGSSSSGSTAGTSTTSSAAIQASDGAPMAYSKVHVASLVDATTFDGTTDLNGSVAIPSNVTYPALVSVQAFNGYKVNYGYIASNSMQSVPVNPITTLIITFAFGNNPSLINSSNAPTSSALTTANTLVNSLFQNIFNAFNISPSQNLLTTTFTENHTGIDIILDSLSIKYDNSGNPSLCVKASNQCTTFQANASSITPFNISPTTVTTINSIPLSQCSSLLSGLTSSTITTNAGLYASNFLSSGLNSSQYMSKLANRLNGMTATLVNPIFQNIDFNGNYVFQFDIANAANQYGGTLTMPVNMQNGSCVLVGDQLPFKISVNSSFVYDARVSSTGSLDTSTYPAVSTPLTAGIIVGAGGDGFGNTSFPDTYNGTTIAQITLDFCDQSMCSSPSNTTPIFSMVKSYNNSGYYYTPNNTNTIPLKSYTSLGINSRTQFYNGNSNPIRVRMYSCQNNNCNTPQLLLTTFIPIIGEYISSSDISSIQLPTVTNAGSILGTQTSTSTAQTLQLNTSTGLIIQSISMTTVNSTVNNGVETDTSIYVLGNSSTSVTINQPINANGTADSYRSISINGNSSTGLPFNVKYVYSISPYST